MRRFEIEHSPIAREVHDGPTRLVGSGDDQLSGAEVKLSGPSEKHPVQGLFVPSLMLAVGVSPPCSPAPDDRRGYNPKIVVTLGGAALDAVKLVERHSLKLKTDVARPFNWFGRVLKGNYWYHTATPGIEWLSRLANHYERRVWFNPEPPLLEAHHRAHHLRPRSPCSP